MRTQGRAAGRGRNDPLISGLGVPCMGRTREQGGQGREQESRGQRERSEAEQEGGREVGERRDSKNNKTLWSGLAWSGLSVGEQAAAAKTDRTGQDRQANGTTSSRRRIRKGSARAN